MRFPSLLPLLLAGFASIGSAQSGVWLDLASTTRTPSSIGLAADAKMRDFASRVTKISAQNRAQLRASGHWDSRIPFSLPTTLRLARGGVALPPPSRGPGDITLVFDSTGSRAFPTAYRDQLISVFTSAKSTLDLVFGQASTSGNVYVRNYDADIGDRDAVAGGYFMPNNGSGQMEIRFPIYVSPEAAAVNFVHCLLLAYIGGNPYGFDAFQEGIARAACMKVVRTPSAMPATLSQSLMESVLDNTYDVGSFYDWYNQRALAGPQFIANNLRDVPLPAGGSLGGIYLLRYQMAGSAWQKLVAENPGFLAEFNRRFYADTSIATNIPALVAVGQAALDTVAGAAGSKVEGLSFSEWFRRQFILETSEVRGDRLLVQPFPITGGLAGSDFGVFLVSATYFESQPGGNEVLLSGTAFPMFWDQNFDRVFPSTQEDSMPIAGAYGSVTPNIPDLNGGKSYRCAVDIPIGSRTARAYLPVGSIATAGAPDPKTLYGTVIGASLTGTQTLRVRAKVGSITLGEPAVVNGAFGLKVTNTIFDGYARVKLEVIRKSGTTDTVLLTRTINKGPGALAVDLRVGGDTVFTTPIAKGIQAMGLGIEPFASPAGTVLGVPEAEVLAAQFNPTTGGWDLYPNGGGLTLGSGHFLRAPAANAAFSAAGMGNPGTPTAISLKPGWNLVVNPLPENSDFSHVQVVKAADSPSTYNDAKGVLIASDAFLFQPGANDAASGAPETGSYVAATGFPKGQAVFVQVLAPEGVSLLFSPATLTARPGHPFVPVGWRMSAKIAVGKAVAEAQIGASNSASAGFDPREDSQMAPLFVGGMRASVNSLYRDVRSRSTSQTYSVRFDGLTKGAAYTVQLKMVSGKNIPFILRDKAAFVTKSLTAPASYTFVAKSSAQIIEISVGAGL